MISATAFLVSANFAADQARAVSAATSARTWGRDGLIRSPVLADARGAAAPFRGGDASADALLDHYLGQSAPMPRRRALTTAQLDELFALPTEPNTLVRY